VTTPDPEDDPLVEAVTTAFRHRDLDGSVRFHAAWYDLDEAGRRAAFDRTTVARQVEAALDADGLSTTARAVLARLTRR
jgi:hypothetical protein